VIDALLAELQVRLSEVGVTGGAAHRLLDETRDHLLESAAASGEVAAVAAFGDTGELARQTAAELGTTRTRRAAVSAFAALAVAGAAYAVVFLTLPVAGAIDITGGSLPGLGGAALAGVVLFPQIAFVAGSLAVARVLRLHGAGPQPAAELRVQRARVVVALISGVLAFASVAAVAIDYHRELAAWWTGAALAVSVPFALLLAGLALRCSRAARSWAPVGETAGNATADLAAILDAVPLLRSAPRPATPARLLLVTVAAASGGVALAGAVAGDPFDGLLRAAFEAVAVLTAFAALGRRLALR
jgi:hypothetical protein